MAFKHLETNTKHVNYSSCHSGEAEKRVLFSFTHWLRHLLGLLSLSIRSSELNLLFGWGVHRSLDHGSLR